MYLKIDTGAKTIELADPDDCEKFHVEVSGSMNPADIDEVIADNAAGRLVGDNAYVSVEKVRGWAEGRVGDDWPKRFQMMLEAAGRNGWMNDDRTYVMAHIKPA